MWWTAWIATTKQLERGDVEWMIAHWPYAPKGPAEWWMPVDPSFDGRRPLFENIMAHMGALRGTDQMPRLEITLRGPDYTERMPRHWIINMEAGLSRGLRKAKLRSFIVMNYYDREYLKLPGATPEALKADNDAAWFQAIMLARFAVDPEGGNWRCLLCQPYPDGQRLNIIRPEAT